MTAERLYTIRVPIEHRRIEAQELRAERLTTPEHIAAAILDVPTPERNDTWLCDNCAARIDPHAPILALGLTAPSYALCGPCARRVATDTPSLLPAAPCPCRGCAAPRT